MVTVKPNMQAIQDPDLKKKQLKEGIFKDDQRTLNMDQA